MGSTDPWMDVVYAKQNQAGNVSELGN